MLALWEVEANADVTVMKMKTVRLLNGGEREIYILHLGLIIVKSQLLVHMNFPQ